MRIRVTVPAADIDGLRETLLQGVDKLEQEETGEEWSGVGKHLTPLRPRLNDNSIDGANRSRAVPRDFRTSQ